MVMKWKRFKKKKMDLTEREEKGAENTSPSKKSKSEEMKSRRRSLQVRWDLYIPRVYKGFDLWLFLKKTIEFFFSS